MFYKIKFKEVEAMTEKATLLSLWQGGSVWLPNKCCFPLNSASCKSLVWLVPDWLCGEKGLQGKPYEPIHKPKHIDPEYNQEAIDELKI